MKAKLVNEAIKHLTPKSSEEIAAAFEQRFQMSFDKFQSNLKKLKDLGVEIKDAYGWYDFNMHNIEVTSFEVFEGNWAVAKCLTRKNAEEILNVHEQFAYTNQVFQIKEGHTYIDIREIVEVINMLKINVKHIKYMDKKGESSSLKNKEMNSDYLNWKLKKYVKNYEG